MSSKKTPRPDKLHSTSFEVPIHFVTEDTDKRIENCFGKWCGDTPEILVRDGMTAHRERECLLHEMLHEIEDVAGLSLKEREVHALSRGLYNLMRANPEIISWLMSD